MDPIVQSPQPETRCLTGERSSNVAVGVFLIAVGLLFLADRAGWSWGWNLSFARLWPLMLIAAGLTKVIVPIEEVVSEPGQPAVRVRRYALGSGVWMVGMGVLFLLHINRVVLLDQSWPLLIVLGGLLLMFGGGRRLRRRLRRR